MFMNEPRHNVSIPNLKYVKYFITFRQSLTCCIYLHSVFVLSYLGGK